MGHADGVAGVGQGELEEGVGHNGTGITKPKQGVVSEHGGKIE